MVFRTAVVVVATRRWLKNCRLFVAAGGMRTFVWFFLASFLVLLPSVLPSLQHHVIFSFPYFHPFIPSFLPSFPPFLWFHSNHSATVSPNWTALYTCLSDKGGWGVFSMVDWLNGWQRGGTGCIGAVLSECNGKCNAEGVALYGWLADCMGVRRGSRWGCGGLYGWLGFGLLSPCSEYGSPAGAFMFPFLLSLLPARLLNLCVCLYVFFVCLLLLFSVVCSCFCISS